MSRGIQGWAGAAHVAVFVGLSLLWVLGVNVLVAAALLAAAPDPALALEHLLDSAWAMVLFTLLQGAGLAAIAFGLAALLPASEEETAQAFAQPTAERFGPRVREAFAWTRPGLAWVVAGLLGAVTAGLLPSWIASEMLEHVPEQWAGSLQAIAELLQEASPAGKAAMVVQIAVVAPVLEELVFRGYLWSAVERSAPSWVAWGVSTILFALYHVYPVHVIALLPTALFLGWLRWASRSVFPCIAAHFVNNAAGAAAILLVADPVEADLPLAGALAGAAFTVGCCATAWWVRRRATGAGR